MRQPPSSGSRFRNTLRSSAVVLLLSAFNLLLSACSDTTPLEIWRQVPIQMARVSQSDSYRQIFILGKPEHTDSESMTIPELQAYDARMDEVFIALIGARNWQHLKNLYGVSSIRDELIARRIHIDGLINFNIYLDPLDHDYVIMEGTGRFFVVRDRTGIILLNGDFHVLPQRFGIDDFATGCIPLEATTYTTRIPGKPTYYKNAVIHYDLKIKSMDDDNQVFSLDYSADHQAYLDLNGNQRYEPSERFATLTMDSRYHQAKLMDLHGIGLVRKDYRIDKQSELEAAALAEIDKRKSCVSP